MAHSPDPMSTHCRCIPHSALQLIFVKMWGRLAVSWWQRREFDNMVNDSLYTPTCQWCVESNRTQTEYFYLNLKSECSADDHLKLCGSQLFRSVDLSDSVRYSVTAVGSRSCPPSGPHILLFNAAWNETNVLSTVTIVSPRSLRWRDYYRTVYETVQLQ